MQFHNCPRCNKKDASHDGERYCGTCEQEYQQELEDFNVLTDLQFGAWVKEMNE